MGELAGFLSAASRRPFAWGQHDCLLLLADWCREVRGIDPADGLRGSYRGRMGAARVIRQAGGMDVLVGRCADLAGARRTDEPMAGDAALVMAPEGPCGAIIVGGGMTARLSERGGLLVDRALILLAWRL